MKEKEQGIIQGQTGGEMKMKGKEKRRKERQKGKKKETNRGEIRKEGKK